MEIHRLVFSPIEVNTYILGDETGDCAIIDCGCYDKFELLELVKLLNDKKLKPVLLLNTHCHLDHIFGNKFMLEKYNLRTLSHEADEINRVKSVQHAQLFGMKMEMPPEPAKFISEGQKVNFGNTEMITIHVPGHSPGSLAFYSEKNGCVFTGDALFRRSIGRADLEGGDSETLMASIKEKLFSLPPETIVYPGHGGSTDIGTEMKHNPFFS
jgi:glyoxylase-like metal-dependent hydrolase (beta-lactamase superfamily II)